jgi:hypothetical protein
VSDPQPPPEEPYSLPGTQPAFEPGHDLPQWPMTAADASPFIPKVVA